MKSSDPQPGDKLRSVRNPDVTCQVICLVQPRQDDKRYKHPLYRVKYMTGKIPALE